MVYDSRKESDLIRLEKRMSGAVNTTVDANVSKVSDGRKTKKKAKPWGNFWQKKRENNEKYLLAAEIGRLEEVKDLLDTSKL